MALPLPVLTAKPIRHPDCCLSISSTFADIVTSILRQSVGSGLVLSVGSGTGLLEALLYNNWISQEAPLHIEGVEVYQSSSATSSANKYLPEQCYATVAGTWKLSPRTRDAAALLFVYPRHPGLVRRYMQDFAQPSSGIQVVVWVGPTSDWPNFESCFSDSGQVCELHGETAGLVDYEMMAVIKRSLQEPSLPTVQSEPSEGI